MVEPVTATYVEENGDWTITVAARGRRLTAHAPGIIAARDRADQLVEKIEPEQRGRTVVHLLNNSALDFTAAYMHARMTRPSDAEPGSASTPAASGSGQSREGVSGSGDAATKTTKGRSRPAARRAPAQTGVKNGGRRAKKEPSEYNGKHADVTVLSGDEVEVPGTNSAQS